MAKQKFNFQSIIPPSEPGSPITIPASVAAPINNNTPKTKSPLDAYKIIPRHKLRLNKRNDYPISEIAELEQYMLQWGVLQDILVIYSLEEDIYIVEAGHRRTTALDNLIKRYRDWDGDPEDNLYLLYQKNIQQYEKGYVCKIVGRLEENVNYDVPDDQMDDSVIDSEIRLIITNEGARNDIPPAVKARNINRLAQLYERKNLSLHNKEEKIKVNKTIAKQIGITERQVINYKNVDRLIPELKALFDQERFSLKVASSYSSLEPDAQLEIAATYQRGETVNAETVKTLKQEQNKSKAQIANLEKQLAEAKNATSASTGPDSKVLLSILFRNIENAVKDLNDNIKGMEIDDSLQKWILEHKEALHELL